MGKRLTGGLLAAMLLASAGPALGADFATREEALALLERAVEEIKADKARALEIFVTGEEGFIDRDLYVFCGGPDGMISTHPDVIGLSLADFIDMTGRAVGWEIYQSARAGKIYEITYKWPRPGEGDVPADKVTFYTKVDDQICGVGYYPH